MTGAQAEQITGLVLAGGRGQRIGGADKGWVSYRGRPLIETVVERFAPQVGVLLISANRNLERYAALAEVVTDADAGQPVTFSGPLTGVLAALRRTRTDWLAIVPCDAPDLPCDLVARLVEACGAGAGSLRTRRRAPATRLRARAPDFAANARSAVRGWGSRDACLAGVACRSRSRFR